MTQKGAKLMQNKNNSKGLFRIFAFVIDIILFNVSAKLAFLIKFGRTIPDFNYSAYEASSVYITIIFLLSSILLGTYVFYNRTIGDVFFTTLISQAITVVLMTVVTFLGRWFSFPRSVLLYTFLISTVILFIWRLIVFYGYLKFSPTRKVTIMGNKQQVEKAIRNFDTVKNHKHEIKQVILSSYEENIEKVFDNTDILYIADPEVAQDARKRIANRVVKAGKSLFFPTNFENLLFDKPNLMNFEDESVIEVSPFKITVERAFIKRFFDIVVSLIGIVILSPIFLLTALAVKMTSPGPIIYSQTRITMNQREFKIYKFRTMNQSAEKKSGPVLATAHDSRITPIGKYLRKLRLDELPQFWNVLKGDMSIVGPRPERPFFVDEFNKEESTYYLRHNVRAGITGYAQVYGKYASDFRSKLQFDLLYIKEYSLTLDLKILMQTIKILFDKVSSQGTDDEQDNLPEIDFAEKNIKVLE